MLKEFIAANPQLSADQILAAVNTPAVTLFEAANGKGAAATREAVEAELAKAADVVFDQRTAVLSVSVGPQNVALSCRVCEAAVIGERVQTGEALATIATGDARNVKLTERDREFVDAVLAAVDAYAEGL